MAGHKHGSALMPPRAKNELIRHMERDHADRVKVPFEPHRWTVKALRELHETIHPGEYA
jgi:hypothetical protein